MREVTEMHATELIVRVAEHALERGIGLHHAAIHRAPANVNGRRFKNGAELAFIFRLRPNRVPRVTTLQCDQPQISTLELEAGGLALEISGQIDAGALVSARTISRLPAIGPAPNRNWLGRFQHDRQLRNRLALDFRRRTVVKHGDEGRERKEYRNCTGHFGKTITTKMTRS